MTPKELLLEVTEKLPPEATIYDAIRELRFRAAVTEGLAALDGGHRVTLEEARRLLTLWITKFTFPPTP